MKYLLVVIYLFSFHSLIAQHPAYYQINDENGLPSNEVYNIVQDNFGYIWIGCDAGLYRYDGFTFKQYTNKRKNGRAISFLQFDEKQRIWCNIFKAIDISANHNSNGLKRWIVPINVFTQSKSIR